MIDHSRSVFAADLLGSADGLPLRHLSTWFHQNGRKIKHLHQIFIVLNVDTAVSRIVWIRISITHYLARDGAQNAFAWSNHQVNALVLALALVPGCSKTAIAVSIDADFVLLPDGVEFFAPWELQPLRSTLASTEFAPRYKSNQGNSWVQRPGWNCAAVLRHVDCFGMLCAHKFMKTCCNCNPLNFREFEHSKVEVSSLRHFIASCLQKSFLKRNI